MEVSSLEDEEWVVLEAFSLSDKETMHVSSEPLSPYFYFYLPFVNYMWVAFPFSPFYMEVLRVLNIEPSQLFPNDWGNMRAFEMVYEELYVTPVVGVFFSFYTTRSTNSRCVSLSFKSGKALFVSYSNYYKHWNDKFTCIRGQDDSLMVLGDDGAPLFPLYRTNNLVTIMGYD